MCAVIRETGNSANISLMNNKSKPCFLVCFLHFWERGDLMKWKLSLQASVARHHAFIIVIILQPGAEATFMRGELENKGELKNKSAVFSRVSRSFDYRTHPTRRHVSRLLKMKFFFFLNIEFDPCDNPQEIRLHIIDLTPLKKAQLLPEILGVWLQIFRRRKLWSK